MVPTYRSLDKGLMGNARLVDSMASIDDHASSMLRSSANSGAPRPRRPPASDVPPHTHALRLIKSVTNSFADFRHTASRWSASLPAFSEYERRKMVLCSDNLHVEFREQYIYEGYRRPNHSFQECLVSLVRLDNNEVINFWTHFLPFLYTMYRLVQLFFVYDVANDDRVWPMVVYMLTANMYLFASSLAHAINCTGVVAHHCCFIVDYLGISIYGVGSSIAYRAYTFTTIDANNLKITDLFDSYSTWAMLIAVSTNIMSSASRFIMDRGTRSFFRIFPFFLQYIYVASPILYRLGLHFQEYSFENIKSSLADHFSVTRDLSAHLNASVRLPATMDEQQAHRIEADFYYILKFLAALVSSFLYGLRIPERFYPRRFDIVGQSHQIFHMTTFTCTLFQLVAVQMDFTKTLELTAPTGQAPNLDKRFFTHSYFPLTDMLMSHTLMMTICLLLNAAIVYYFYVKTITDNPWRRAHEFMSFTSCCSKDYCESCYSCCKCSCECHLLSDSRPSSQKKVTFDTDEAAPGESKKHE